MVVVVGEGDGLWRGKMQEAGVGFGRTHISKGCEQSIVFVGHGRSGSVLVMQARLDNCVKQPAHSQVNTQQMQAKHI